MRSASMRSAPFDANSSDTVDLPDPIPPVIPTTTMARNIQDPSEMAGGDRPAPHESRAGNSPTEQERWQDRVLRFGEATDGSAGLDGIPTLDVIDRVAAFRPAILAIRWGTTAVSLGLAASELADQDTPSIFWATVILLYTLLRTVRPIRYTGDVRSLLAVLAEVALLVLAVDTTGGWDSPFVFSLTTAVIVAGFARGFGFGIRIAVVSALAVSIPYLVPDDATQSELRVAAQWSVSLFLVGLTAGFVRRVSGEADRQHSLALDRLDRLADANALLFSLHRVTQSLPASLEMGDVLDQTIGRIRGLISFDAAAILAFDDTDTSWELLRSEGVRLPSRLERSALPPALQQAVEEETVIAVSDLQGLSGPGLSGRAGSGIYATLETRGAVIGAIAIESRRDNAYDPRDVELFRELKSPIALAIDNARWFSRLRTVGADEERTRIARDLHDRIGQSLAYLAFECDRIVGRNERAEDVSSDLERLRSDIRGVIGEVRDTLYDLRTDVSEKEGMADVLESFADRVRGRSSLDIELRLDRADRLPILQEREMWRIAQEAITNVERHAEANKVQVTWQCSDGQAVLQITDDGKGFPAGNAGRLDSYGILGMRERASSVGASLDINTEEGRGTTVACRLATT